MSQHLPQSFYSSERVASDRVIQVNVANAWVDPGQAASAILGRQAWWSRDQRDIPWEDTVSENEQKWNDTDGWNQHQSSYGSKRGGKDAEPPEWDGKSDLLSKYIRKVQIWTATTHTSPYQQGLRLLNKLTGDAFEKMELVEPRDLMIANGAKLSIKMLTQKRTMDDFMDHFRRNQD